LHNIRTLSGIARYFRLRKLHLNDSDWRNPGSLVSIKQTGSPLGAILTGTENAAASRRTKFMTDFLSIVFFLNHPAFIFAVLGLAVAAYSSWAKLLSLMRNHPLISFFTLTLGITWAAFIPYYYTCISGGDAIPWFTFGPMLAGIAMAAATDGFKGLKSLATATFRWKVKPIWYVAAIGVPFASQYISVLLNPLFGSAAPDWTNIPPLVEILPMVALFAVFSGPLGEEVGWRGFALPRLLETRSALAASLILGSVWAVWHLPLILVGDFTSYGAFMPVIAAIAFTWVSQNARSSVLLAILMHASYQNSVRYLGKVFIDADHVQQQWIGVAVWVIFVGAILLFYGTRRFTGPVEQPAALAARA
jgi:uncharacterized protein